jgi:hypothetical protein
MRSPRTGQTPTSRLRAERHQGPPARATRAVGTWPTRSAGPPRTPRAGRLKVRSAALVSTAATRSMTCATSACTRSARVCPRSWRSAAIQHLDRALCTRLGRHARGCAPATRPLLGSGGERFTALHECPQVGTRNSRPLIVYRFRVHICAGDGIRTRTAFWARGF